jgi:hypothetical protein
MKKFLVSASLGGLVAAGYVELVAISARIVTAPVPILGGL